MNLSNNRILGNVCLACGLLGIVLGSIPLTLNFMLPRTQVTVCKQCLKEEFEWTGENSTICRL